MKVHRMLFRAAFHLTKRCAAERFWVVDGRVMFFFRTDFSSS